METEMDQDATPVEQVPATNVMQIVIIAEGVVTTNEESE